MTRKLISVALVLLLMAATASAETRVRMETNAGTILLALDEEKAPKTVENFLRYVEEGFYEGTIFHRVIDNFMIQGGGFTESYQRKQTRAPIENEAKNGLKNTRGSIAMARTSDPHSATAQFFINVNNNDFLDYPSRDGWGYTVFGNVIEGMEVVDKIRQVETGPGGPFQSDAPKTPVIINRVTVIKDSETN